GADRCTDVVDAGLIDSSTPTRIKGLRVEEAVSRADDRLVVKRVGNSDAWRITGAPVFLRIGFARARIPPFIAGEGQPAGATSRTRVRTKIEEGHVVVLFSAGCEFIPANAVIEAEFWSDLPGVAQMQDKGLLPDVNCVLG